MSITFRVLMMLACAYAGWETAGIEREQLPEPHQLAQTSSSQFQHRW